MKSDNMSQVNTVKEIKTRVTTCRLRDDGILESIGFQGVEVKLADAIEIIEAQAVLAAGKKHPLIVNIIGTKHLDRDARMYFTGKKAEINVSFMALVVNSSIEKMIANFIIGFNKSSFPVKVFTSEEESISWLKGLMK